MDEMEKDLLPETEQTDENTADVPEETAEAVSDDAKQADELYEELEEIKDMFQKELDKATAEAEQGELIQELSDIEESSDEDEGFNKAELCQCCEENPCATEYGEDYPYCESCRAFMKRYPLRKSGIFMAFLVVVLVFGTMATSLSAVNDNLLSGYAYKNNGQLMSSMQSYYYYLASADQNNVSMTAVKGLIDSYVKTGYMSDAVKLINQYYSETDLKMPWNSKYRKIVEQTQLNTSTYYAVSEIVSAAFNGEDYDYDEVIEKLEALRNETDEEGNRLYGDLFIDYFVYEMMRIDGKSLEEQLNYLKEMDQKHKNGGEWVYLASLCSVAAKSGDEELTKDCFNRLIKINKQDQNAYLAYASYYRFAETPDAEKIIEICNEAAANAYSGDVTYKQYLAIAYLLKGEGNLALTEMEEYMSAGSYNVSQCNLYALIGLYNGNMDVYDSMKNILETNGYKISELVEQYKDKEITVEEVLADKGGDIA